MSYTEEQLRDLVDQAHGMPYGPGQSALLEQVIGHADAMGLRELAFEARMMATTSYVYGGEPARSVVTFAWCVAEFDRDPVTYGDQYGDLLWQFKYTVSALQRFPDVPLDRTYAVLDDMQRRWQETGHTMHAVYACRHAVARHVGDAAAAEEYYRLWCAQPRDDLSNCEGCDPSSKADWLASCGRDGEAVALADAVLSRPPTCSEQPQRMLTTIMVPYLRTGRLDAARDAHRRAYRLHRPQIADLDDIADHVEFCARTGNEARAVEILERHLGWLDRAPSPFAAMRFAAAGALALARAQKVAGTAAVSLQRPAHGDRSAARVDAADLEVTLADEATRIADLFDRRNGTDRVGASVRELLEAQPWIDYLPLSPTAPRRPGATAPPSTMGDLVAPPAGPKTVAPTPAAPATAGPDELLDLIEEHYLEGQADDGGAALDAFADRYGATELTVAQRARLADARGVRAVRARQFAEALELFRAAAPDYAAAQLPEQEQRVHARAGTVLCRDGQRDEGLPAVTAATDWLLAHGTPRRRAGDAILLATCHLSEGQGEAAMAALQRAEPHLPEAPARTRAAHGALRLVALGQLGRLDEVLRDGPATIEVASAAGLTDDLARAHATMAQSLEQTGEFSQAADHITAAMAVLTDPEVRAAFATIRANMLARSDRAGEAVDDLVEAVADRTAHGDAAAAADLRHSLAIAYLNLDRPLDAAEVAEEELAYRLMVDRRGDDPPTTAAVRHLLASVYQRLGESDDALTQLDAAADECARGGDRAGVATMAAAAGELLAREDRDDEAAARFLIAADACAELGWRGDELANRRHHALSLYWAHGLTRAMPALRAADLAAAGMPADDPELAWERARIDYDAARILWDAGELADAADRADRAARAAARISSTGAAADALLLRATILLDDGRPADAEGAAREALADLPVDDRSQAVHLLAIALREQGLTDAAAAVWEQFGVPRPESDGHGP